MRAIRLALALCLVAACSSPAFAFVGLERTYAGSINNQLHITMVLERQGELVTGRYMYDHVGQWLMLQGEVDEEEVLVLDEYDANGALTGTFSGQWEPNRLWGQWRNPDGSTNLPFNVEAAPEDRISEDEFVKPTWSHTVTATIHPSLPPMEFVIQGFPGSFPTTASVERMEIRVQGRPGIPQLVTHLNTETGLPGETDYFGDTQPLTVEDMNLDGYMDIRLKEMTSFTGTTQYLVWTYDPAMRRFVRRPDLEVLVSPIVDPAARTITSADRDPGGVYTRTYGMENDMLIFLGEEYEPF